MWRWEGEGGWQGGSGGPARSPGKRVRMGKEPQRSGREFPRGGREGCAACGDAIPPSRLAFDHFRPVESGPPEATKDMHMPGIN